MIYVINAIKVMRVFGRDGAHPLIDKLDIKTKQRPDYNACKSGTKRAFNGRKRISSPPSAQFQ